MRNFVIVSLSPFDIEMGSNCRDIAIELAKSNKVLYVNIPVKRSELYSNNNYPEKAWKIRKQVLKGQEEGLKKISTNLWQLYPDIVLEPINRLKPIFLFDWLNQINGRRYAKSILKATARLGFDEYIFINDNDIYNGLYLPKYLNSQKSIYYLRDNLSAMPYWAMHASRVERKLFINYDQVQANSTYLKEYASHYNQASFYVGQGCDLSVFQNSKDVKIIPNDMAELSKPIIGYAGALNSQRLNIDLIKKLAIESPEWSFVYVGSPDSEFQNTNFSKLGNLYFLGQKKLEELPSYLNFFDVCINPQAINDLTIGNYPRKIDEYLAMGKPVVATKTLAMEPFKDYCYLAESGNEYKKLIQKALDENSDVVEKGRKEFAQRHSWENSVAEMLKHID